MAMAAVRSTNILEDTVTKIATFLRNNVTDPIAATRAQTRWVFTSYPERNIEYPIVTITQAAERDEHISIGSEYKAAYITLRIEVWSHFTDERDQVWDDIYDEFRTHYTTADANGDKITGLGLHDMIITNCLDIDTEAPTGKGHIHRKIATIQFTYYATS